MTRDPDKIQREIETTRTQLAATLDALAERTSPKRLTNEAKESVVAFFRTPPGMAALGAAGLLVALRLARRARNRRRG